MARPGSFRHPQWRRRRGGIAGCTPGQTFDGEVTAIADDGWSHSGGTFNTVLITTYIGRDGTPNAYNTWYRFQNVTVPGGARIDVAHITVQSTDSGADGSGVKSTIYANDVDDAAAPTNQADHAGKARTTAGVVWDDVDFTEDTDTNSPDFSSVLQEVFDRPGWASGQDLMILWDDNGGTDGLNYRMHTEDNPENIPAKLHVEYCA